MNQNQYKSYGWAVYCLIKYRPFLTQTVSRTPAVLTRAKSVSAIGYSLGYPT